MTRNMEKLPLLSLATLILVFLGGFFVFTGQASAQAYCGDSLRLDPIRCDLIDNGWEPMKCNKVQLSGPQYVASCTGNPSNCFTNFDVSGSVNGCTGPSWRPSLLGEYVCTPTAKKAACWVNPGDSPPPPPPSNGTCGKACSSSSECGGLTCAPAKVCWGNSCDTGGVAKHRIKVKALDCNGNGTSGVKIKAWGNTCTTGGNGTCIINKNVACQDSVGGGDQLATSVVAGAVSKIVCNQKSTTV